MARHTPRDVKKICKGGDNLELYLTLLKIQESFTIGEASIVTGFSEDVIRSATEKGHLLISVPKGSKEGRILRKSLEDWMRRNEISLDALIEIRKVS